ncbi:MAG: repressor LexA [Clostridia bacterium]|nr:repressor LexA [Clostridia bacterium]
MRSKDPVNYGKITDFINRFADRFGYSPSMTEISEGTGIPKTTVHRYIAEMREKGELELTGHRTLNVAGTRRDAVRVPVLGAVSCGVPKFAEENIEEYVRLPASLFGDGDFFILRASGDSMIGAGIDDGDLVLVKRQDRARAGQIVVALTGDEATLKRFYPEPERRRVRLHPENPELEDIYVDDCLVQGVAVKVIKDVV